MGLLTGKAAVVTGSTGGLGLAIARAFAAEGADLMLNGFGSAKEIAALTEALAGEFGVRVLYDPADVPDYDAVAAMQARAAETFGALHIVVNNAGIQDVAPTEGFPLDRWDAIIATDLTGVFYGTRAAIPHLKRAGWGRIVNMSSVQGLIGSIHKAAYGAAKHGVIGFTKVAALELASSGITVNAICPGFVLTQLVERQVAARAGELSLPQAEAERSLLMEKQPTLRFVTREQIGAAALFLCSPGADNTTGTALTLDGGWTAR